MPAIIISQSGLNKIRPIFYLQQPWTLNLAAPDNEISLPLWCHPTPPPCLTPLTSNLLDTVGWAENKLGCSKNTAPLSPIFAAEAKIQQGSIEGNPSASKFHVSHYKHAKGCMQGRRTFKKLHPRTLENHVLYFFNTSCFVGASKILFP